MHQLSRHRLDHDLRLAGLGKTSGHQPQITGTTGLLHQHIRQHHREGCIAHDRPRAVHRMPQPQRPALAHRSDLQLGWRDVAQHLQQFLLAPALQLRFQFVVHIEVILDGLLAGMGYQHDFIDTRGQRLFHHVLDHRLVHHRDHLLGNRLAGRQKARTQPCNR